MGFRQQVDKGVRRLRKKIRSRHRRGLSSTRRIRI